MKLSIPASIVIAGLAVGFGIAHHGRYVAVASSQVPAYTVHDTWLNGRISCMNGPSRQSHCMPFANPLIDYIWNDLFYFE